MITPERRCKNKKPVVPIAAEPHQHLHQDQGCLRTSTLEDLFEKPFKNSFNLFSHSENHLIYVKTVIARPHFM